MAREVSLLQHLKKKKKQKIVLPELLSEDQSLWYVEKSTDSLTGDIQKLKILICSIHQALISFPKLFTYSCLLLVWNIVRANNHI
uniref:Replication factor C subunit 2 n=1 Tax=Arundo donax TaxID=35708 RepID=A0A0A9FZQ7_ARUDO